MFARRVLALSVVPHLPRTLFPGPLSRFLCVPVPSVYFSLGKATLDPEIRVPVFEERKSSEWRTHYSIDTAREDSVGERVTVCGWVEHIRPFGKFCFAVVRCYVFRGYAGRGGNVWHLRETPQNIHPPDYTGRRTVHCSTLRCPVQTCGELSCTPR
jgi:hypothetical protein